MGTGRARDIRSFAHRAGGRRLCCAPLGRPYAWSMTRLIAALCLAVAVPAVAQETEDAGGGVYRWTDQSGQDHYTDDPTTIPERYRKKATRTEGRELMEVTAEGVRTSASSAGTYSPPVGPNEDAWRERFAALHKQIAALEAQLEKDRALVKNSVPQLWGGVPRTAPEVAEAQERIPTTEQKLAEARAALEELDREASREAVPREWRRP